MARMNRQPAESLSAEDLNNPCVFVVDMINGFTREGALADPAIAACASPIRNLLEKTQAKSLFITDCHEQGAAEFNSFPEHCLKGSAESQVMDELSGFVGEVLEKNCISAAAVPGFTDWLDALGENRDLVVTGCCTDLCVLQLALPLVSYINQMGKSGMRVIIPEDCVDTYHIDGVHDAKFWNETALDLMKANGVLVVGSIQA